MSEWLLSEFALHVYGLRHAVLLVALIGIGVALTGTYALVRHARMDNLLQAVLALFDLPLSLQLMVAYLVVRACMCLTVLWTHDVHGALLPFVLFFGSLTAGIVARDVAGTVRGVLIDAVDLCLIVAHALVSGYLALVPFNFPLLVIAACLAILALLTTLVALLGDGRRVLDSVSTAAV